MGGNEEKQLDESYYNPDLKNQIKRAQAYKKSLRRYNIISLVIFAALVLTAAACMIFMKRPDVSEIEKRSLAEKPEFSLSSFFSGEYTDNFSLYFSDTVPFREKLVSLSSYLKKARGISSPSFYGAVEIVADEDGNSVEEEYTETTAPPVTSVVSSVVSDENNETSIVTDTVTVTQETTTAASSGDINIADFSNNGIVVDGVKMYGEDAGVMLFGGNKKQGKRYADIINKYHEALGDSVNVWNIVVPTSAEFYLPLRFSKYSASEKDAIDNIYANLAEGVTGVDAYSVLAEHTDEYIYFRTDHHWTPLGAYYAYTAFMDALGMEYHPIEDYTEKVKTGFVGSLYGYTGDVTLLNAPEEFHYFLPPEVNYTTSYYSYDTLAPKGSGALFHEYVEGGNCYGMFLGADAIHTKISTDVRNGRKIAVFKESYGNAFVPFLVNNFEEIYVIDIRYFGTNAVEYLKKTGVTDVLFIDNCFAANTSSLISGIERMFESDTGTVTTTVPPETSAADEKSEKTSAKTKKNTKKTTTDSKSKNAETSAPETEKKPAVTSVPQTDAPDEKQTVVPAQ